MTLPGYNTKEPSVCFFWGEYLKLRQQEKMKKKGIKAKAKTTAKAKDSSDSDSSSGSELELNMEKNMESDKRTHITLSNWPLGAEPAMSSTYQGTSSAAGHVTKFPEIGQKRPLDTGNGIAPPRPFKHMKLNHAGSGPSNVPDIFGPINSQHSHTSVPLPSTNFTTHPQQHIPSMDRPNDMSALFHRNESLIPASFDPAFSMGFTQPLSSQSQESTTFPAEAQFSFQESFGYGAANTQPLLPLEPNPQWSRPVVQLPGSSRTMKKTDQMQGTHMASYGSEADMHLGGPRPRIEFSHPSAIHAGQPTIQQQQSVHPALQGNVIPTQIGSFQITPGELQKIMGMRAQGQGYQNAQLMGSRGA